MGPAKSESEISAWAVPFGAPRTNHSVGGSRFDSSLSLKPRFEPLQTSFAFVKLERNLAYMCDFKKLS